MGGSSGAIRDYIQPMRKSFNNSTSYDGDGGCEDPEMASEKDPHSVTTKATAEERMEAIKCDAEEAKIRLSSSAFRLQSRRLNQNGIHTKGYYVKEEGCKKPLFRRQQRPRPLFLQLLSVLDTLKISVSKGSFTHKLYESYASRILCTLFLFLFLMNNLSTSNGTLLGQSTCDTFGWNAFPVWKYRAKPRFVPPLQRNQEMQLEFLELFKGGHPYHHHNYHDSSSSEEDSGSFEHYVDDVELDIPTLQRVADMCPKTAFFYSLSPKHLEATLTLSRMFVAQPSPPDLLRLAKALRFNRYVNPKVWYYALIAAAEERPDMSGFRIPHPIDAMPDLFIPGPLLFDVMDKYRTAVRLRDAFARNGTVAAITSVMHISKRKGRSVKNSKSKSKSNSTSTLAPTRSLPLKKRKGRKIGRSRVLEASRNETFLDAFDMISGPVTEYPMVQKTTRPSRVPKKKKGSDGKKKKKKMKERKEDLFEYDGNFTEYSAESGMWKKARIGAFEDCLVVDGFIGVRNGEENKLWYFREDMMVSQHHYYWHSEYPINATKHRPRRAELFFYMHRNLIARYNAERYSNGMSPLRMFDIRPGAEIKSPYDSQLADVNSGKFWTPRPTGVTLQDILHQDDPDFERNIFIDVYNQLHGRLIRSVEIGYLLTGIVNTMSIRHTKGIEPLGNTVEASELSVNPFFYDAMGFHNLGHQIIGLATDNEYKHKLPTGVMADTATTMRDPEFYTYHTVVDDIFDRYKRNLPPYQPKGGQYPLRWDGVEILNVEVVSKKGGPYNELRTFWATKRFPLGAGVDGSIHKGDLDVDVCAVHLQHEPFDFKITVTLDPCAKTKTNKGTVRIFMAPRYDEHGHRLHFKEQRRMMIHMDSFPVDLRVGRNVILRRSYDSNAVIPWTKHIHNYEHDAQFSHSADYCGCGWPTHLYIPKGSKEGSPFDLFVMITNFDHDYVENSPKNLLIPEPCNSPYMYCGVKNRNYPDAKPMGYPFDRLPFSVPIKCPHGQGPIWPFLLCKFLQFFWYRPIQTLEEYVSYAPNMAAAVVEIKHFDHLVW